MKFDGKAFGEEVVGLVKQFVERETAPLREEIERLKAAKSVTEAVIDRNGNLVLTMSDGSTKDMGCVVGKDGKDGRDGVDGKDGAPGEKGADGRDGKDGIDGAPGKDGEPGKDGVSADDIDLEVMDDGKTLMFSFDVGQTRHSFEIFFPVVVDRGVFKDGNEYQKGDAVTWGGSLWIAQRDTKAKPGTGDDDWRLAVKKGRDGKDAA